MQVSLLVCFQMSSEELTSNISIINTSTAASPVLHHADPPFAISEVTFKRFNLVNSFILSPLVSLIGIIGNSVGLYILRKDQNRRNMSIYTYLFSLMVFDIAPLFCGFELPVTDVIALFDKELGQFLQSYTFVIVGYFNILLKHMSAVMLIVMSLERWLSMVFPFKVKYMVLSKHPKTITVLSFILTAMYVTPFSISFRPATFKDEENNTVYANNIAEDFQDMFFVYRYFETVILLYICPAVILIINILIVIAYSRILQKKQSTLKTDKNTGGQTKVTAIVLSVAGLYILLSIPFIFIQSLLLTNEDYSFYGPYKFTFFVFIRLGDLLARVNAAVDFFIYIFVSNHYRGILTSIMCKCLEENKTVEFSSSGNDRS